MYVRPRPSGNRKRLWASIALVLFLFTIDVFSGGKLRAQLRAGASTLHGWGGAASERVFGSGFFSSRAQLAAQNRSLREQLAQYQERAAAHAVLQEENAELRELVHLVRSAEGVTAPLISSARSSPYGTFLIGAGASEGVARGNIVLTPGGFVIGEVSDVASHTALVREALAPLSKAEATIRGVAVEVEGRGGGNGYAEAPRSLTIGKGDPVTVPAYAGRPIGVVGEVASSSASASQEIFIRIPASLPTLPYVYVSSSI